MNAVWIKRLLLVAAAWNVVGGVSSLLDPAQHFAQMYSTSLSLEDPLQLYFYRCTWINVIAWGAAYFLAAIAPHARTAVLAAGAAGKAVYCVACLALFASGAGKVFLVFTGAADLAFAALFALALVSQRQGQARESRAAA
jgi:hypothetical protein